MEYVFKIVHFSRYINIVYLKLEPVLNLPQTKLSRKLRGKLTK